MLEVLRSMGVEVNDLGCFMQASVDYPDIAYPLAQAVGSGTYDLGILVGGNGIGMCIVANKARGVRSAVANDEFTARVAREQQHCNVLCLGAGMVGHNGVRPVVEAFLAARLGEGRHVRRVEKIARLEAPAETLDSVGTA